MQIAAHAEAKAAAAAAADPMDAHLAGMGLAGDADEGGRARSASPSGRGRFSGKRKRDCGRDESRSVDPHNRSLTPSRDKAGLADEIQLKKAKKLRNEGQRKPNAIGRIGDGDRMHRNKMPKHLFSGKRGNGKTDRR